MSTVLFWRGGQVIEGNEPTAKEAARLGCLGAPCVDTNSTIHIFRYGTLDFRKHEWKHLPFEQFPPGFKTALLLLEVR